MGQGLREETGETLQSQTDRRKSATEKNAQRSDIDEVMGEGGGDEEEDGESEDDNEDVQGSVVDDKFERRQKEILSCVESVGPTHKNALVL